MNFPFKKIYSVNDAIHLIKFVLNLHKANWVQTNDGIFLCERYKDAIISLVILRVNFPEEKNLSIMKIFTFGEIIALLSSILMVNRPHISIDTQDLLLLCIADLIDKNSIPDQVTQRLSDIILKKEFINN